MLIKRYGESGLGCRSMPPNKQLQRTVVGHRGDVIRQGLTGTTL